MKSTRMVNPRCALIAGWAIVTAPAAALAQSSVMDTSDRVDALNTFLCRADYFPAPTTCSNSAVVRSPGLAKEVLRLPTQAYRKCGRDRPRKTHFWERHSQAPSPLAPMEGRPRCHAIRDACTGTTPGSLLQLSIRTSRRGTAALLGEVCAS